MPSLVFGETRGFGSVGTPSTQGFGLTERRERERWAFGVRVRDDPTHPSLSPGTSSRSAAVQRLTPRRARRWHSILFTLVIDYRELYVTYQYVS